MSATTEESLVEGSLVYPLGSRVNERRHLEVGGCDVVEVAAEFGTPVYIYAEDDIRARARAYLDAFRARTDDFDQRRLGCGAHNCIIPAAPSRRLGGSRSATRHPA